MRIINKKYLLIILLVGVILTGAIILKPTKGVKLDNVILKQEVNNKTFAMYKEDDDNNYVKVEDNKFPDMYVLNLTKSKCIDNNGNELDGVLSYENNKVTITSGNTTYCYLYFDKSLGLEIKENNPKGLSEEIKGAMYRFQGQAKDDDSNELVNNYICFGTSEKEECVRDKDKYMYRIIGIEAETGRVKVIKKEALKETESETYQWWDKDNEDIKFPDSKIYKAISGSDFLENTDYVPTGWEDKIATNTWTYGDMLSNDTIGAKQTGPELYQTETGKKATRWYNYATADTLGAYSVTVESTGSPYSGQIVHYTNGSGNWTDTFTGKVSLMYLHDYYLSVGNEANCQYDAGQYEECKTGWMHLSQNDPGLTGTSTHEWTMSRFGWDPNKGWFRGHYVIAEGCSRFWTLNYGLSVRPVFYINASEELLSGTGTLSDPFIIKS